MKLNSPQWFLPKLQNFIENQDATRPVCIAICDSSGNLVCFVRMKDAPERCIAIAQAKAYTSAKLNDSTKSFADRLKNENLTLHDFCDERFTAMAGGWPLINGGAVGISGRTCAEDEELAKILAQIFET